jgi:hypothetical protein
MLSISFHLYAPNFTEAACMVEAQCDQYSIQ